MGLRRCCCRKCKIFADNFDRADSTNLGSDWTEAAGNSEIADNVLRMNGAAKVSHGFTLTEEKVDRVVKALVRAQNSGDIARIHLGNPASTTTQRRIAEVQFAAGAGNGALRIYQVSGAVETLRRECPITAVPGEWYPFAFGNHLPSNEPGQTCYAYWQDAFQFAWLHNETGFSLGSQLRYIGLESDAANYVEFDNLVVEKTNQVENRCPRIGECCWPNLANLEGSELEVELSGFTNGTCGTCGDVNGTYTLTPSSLVDCDTFPFPRCACWRYEGDVGTCSGWDSIQVNAVHDYTNNRCLLYLRIGGTEGSPKITVGSPQNLGNSPMTKCGLNEWITITEAVRFSTDCGASFTVKVRLKP